MQTDRLEKKQLTPRYSIKGDLPKGHINSFLLSYVLNLPLDEDNKVDIDNLGKCNEVKDEIFDFLQTLENTNVRVKYYDSSTAHVLYSNIPILFLVDKTNLESGSSGYQNLVDLSQELNSILAGADADPVKINKFLDVINAFGRLPILNLLVPVGSVDLQTGDTMEVEVIDNTSNGGVLTNTYLHIYSVSSDFEPFHVIKVDKDSDLHENHEQVIESYVYDSSKNAEFDLEVRAENTNYSTDKTGCVAISSINSKIEGRNVARTYLAFKGVENLPEDVYLKVFETTTSIDDISIINVRVESNEAKYISQRQSQVMNLQRVVSKTSQTNEGRAVLRIVQDSQN